MRVKGFRDPETHLCLKMPCVYPWFYIQTKLTYNTKQALTCQSHRVLTLLSLDQGANSGVWCHDGIYQQSECRPGNETFGTCKAEKEKYTHQGHTVRQTVTPETPRHLAKTFTTCIDHLKRHCGWPFWTTTYTPKYMTPSWRRFVLLFKYLRKRKK